MGDIRYVSLSIIYCILTIFFSIGYFYYADTQLPCNVTHWICISTLNMLNLNITQLNCSVCLIFTQLSTRTKSILVTMETTNVIKLPGHVNYPRIYYQLDYI